MSDENVEIVLRWYEAWNRGDLDEMLERIAPDWRFETVQLFADTEATYEGREGFIKFRNTFAAAWEKIQVVVERTEDLGDKVLMLFTFHGKGRGSGVEVAVPYANLVTVKGGSIVHVRGFAAWDEALEAAGLSK